MQAAGALASNQPEDPRFLGFTSYAEIIYNINNPDKKNVPHVYGVDERGKKKHLAHEDVLYAYGYTLEESAQELSIGKPEQLTLLPEDDTSQSMYEPHAFTVKYKGTSQILPAQSVVDRHEQDISTDELPLSVKQGIFSGSKAESPTSYFRAASLGVLAGAWLRARGQKTEPVTVTPDHEPYLTGLKNLESSEVRHEDGERRKKNKKVLGAVIVLGLFASAAFLKHEAGFDLESMAPTTTITDIPKEVSIDVSPVPTTTTAQNPAEEPAVTTTSEPEDETSDKSTVPVVTPPAGGGDPDAIEPVDGGVAILDPVDSAVSPAVRLGVAEMTPEVGEVAILNPIDDTVSQAVRVEPPEVTPEMGELVFAFNTEVMPWTYAENLGVTDIRGFLQSVLDRYNAEFNHHFVWHEDGMYWQDGKVINPPQLGEYYIVFQKMYSDL